MESRNIIEFLIGLFLIPFIVKWILIFLFAYLNIFNPNYIYYGPFVLEGILALILFRYKKPISLGLIINIIFRIILPLGIGIVKSFI